MKCVIQLAVVALFAAVSFASPAAAITFGDGKYLEKLYDGCATERDLFAAVKRYGAKPKKLISSKPGVVLIRGRDKDGKTYDFAVVPCQLMVDGRFAV